MTANREEKPIRAVLFDYGGVIAEEGFISGLMSIAEQQNLDGKRVSEVAMDAVYESGYVTGMGSEVAFWERLRKQTGMSGDDAALRGEILSRFVLRPWMIELVRALRKKDYLTGILSDQTDWLDLLDEQQHFFREFDQAFVSYGLGKGKRDATLFNEIAQQLHLAPAQIIFIDDAPGNIERAVSRGWRGLLYTGQQSLIDQLSALLGLDLQKQLIR